MKFDQYRINEGIKKNIANLGLKKPTDIQFKSIPAILKGEDVLAIAQTGTGKTAAFAIPVIHLLKSSRKNKGIRCLVMAPTHELARQLHDTVQHLATKTGVRTACIHGGVKQAPQVKQLLKGVDILIATPGRLFDLLHQKALQLNAVQILVLDEADHMLDLGFIHDIRQLIHHLPKKRQTLFFSATINEKIKKLAYSLVTNPIRIQISPKNPVAKNIEHGVAMIHMDDKRFFLEAAIKDHPEQKFLVFVRTKVRAERVKKAMARVGLEADTIHSDRLQEDRTQVLNQFKKGTLKVLIATDVSARGIDIPHVDVVVNYDLPESAEHYVHRVGRTGRANKKGRAISFCSEEERELLLMIEENLGKPVERIAINQQEYREMLDLSTEASGDWKALLAEERAGKSKKRKK